MWIWEENAPESKIIGNSEMPYVNQLAQTYGYAANMHNLSKPSLPNYVGATWGDTFCLNDDYSPAQRPLPGPAIFDQLPSGDAMVFAESMATNCQTADKTASDVNHQGYYRVHHTAWPYDTSSATTCQSYDRPFQGRGEGATTDALADQITAGLPHFTMVVPAVCNDMHAGSVCVFDSTTGPDYYTRADWWLQTNLPDVFAGPDWQAGNLVIFLTWDEGTGGGYTDGMDCTTSSLSACHPVTIVISPTTSHVVANDNFNHYSMLRTTEELIGLPLLGYATVSTSMASAFNLP
jgi:hypothetical protein